jgi:hypothetical protein
MYLPELARVLYAVAVGKYLHDAVNLLRLACIIEAISLLTHSHLAIQTNCMARINPHSQFRQATFCFAVHNDPCYAVGVGAVLHGTRKTGAAAAGICYARLLAVDSDILTTTIYPAVRPASPTPSIARTGEAEGIEKLP